MRGRVRVCGADDDGVLRPAVLHRVSPSQHPLQAGRNANKLKLGHAFDKSVEYVH